jgi:hypothetical protein
VIKIDETAGVVALRGDMTPDMGAAPPHDALVDDSIASNSPKRATSWDRAKADLETSQT